jgi:hypothetical protein
VGILEEDLQRVEVDLASAEAELARLGARVEGLRAEREALIRAISSFGQDGAASIDQDVAGMVKADAIVAVLRRAKPQPLRTDGIVNALHKAGRPAEVKANVSVYLDSLLKQGRVLRVTRGEYTVPD